jgi:hypothetical protein
MRKAIALHRRGYFASVVWQTLPMHCAGSTVARWWTRSLLAVSIVVLLAACAMGDVLNGPPPVDVTVEQIVGTWVGHDDAGTFVFAADGTLTARGLPADALPPIQPTQRWSCTGTWRITHPVGGDPQQSNMLELDLRELPGVNGGYGGWMSASKPKDVIVLSMDKYWYTKQA